MRSPTLSILAVAAITSAATAQGIPFEIYPGTTSFTTRTVLVRSAGEIHQGFLSGLHRGLGRNGTTCSLGGVVVTIQDQNASTPSLYGLTVRTGTDASGPNATAGGVLLQTGPVYNLPASTLTTAYAWTVTATLSTPLSIPCDQFVSVGIELEAAPAWTSDGLSIHMSTGTGPNVTQQAHANAPNMVWSILGTTTYAQSDGRSYRIAPLFHSAFQAGNVDTIATLNHFGTGGYFPDTTLTGAASQGLAFRCAHPGGATATAYVCGSIFGFSPAPIQVGGIGNRFHLELNGLFPFVIASGPADGSVIPFVAAGLDVLPSAAGLMLGFQALVVGSTVEFTNAVGTVLL